jgi:hypothetical protein
MRHHMTYNTSRQSGNVLFYIFLCVALLGALTMALTRGGGEQAAATTSFRASEDIKTQAQIIRSAIMECMLVQNSGYPTEPASKLLSDVQCEMAYGTPQNLFTAQAARAIPQPPTSFNPWQYTNSGNGAYVSASIKSTRASSPSVVNSLSALADIFKATQTSSSSKVYQNQEVCIINNGTIAEFHVCLKSGTGQCGKASPANQNAAGSPCTP